MSRVEVGPRATRRRLRRWPLHLSVLVIALVGLPALVIASGPAWAHGGEEAALAEAPARTLVQQALALLTQEENVVEARERLELALESRDKEDVDLGAVREALNALERDDQGTTIEHLNAALAPGQAPERVPAEPTPDEEAAHEEEKLGPAGDVAATGEAAVSEESLEHTREFDPDRDAAEWLAVIAGIALGLGAIAVLARCKRSATG